MDGGALTVRFVWWEHCPFWNTYLNALAVQLPNGPSHRRAGSGWRHHVPTLHYTILVSGYVILHLNVRKNMNLPVCFITALHEGYIFNTSKHLFLSKRFNQHLKCYGDQNQHEPGFDSHQEFEDRWLSSECSPLSSSFLWRECVVSVVLPSLLAYAVWRFKRQSSLLDQLCYLANQGNTTGLMWSLLE